MRTDVESGEQIEMVSSMLKAQGALRARHHVLVSTSYDNLMMVVGSLCRLLQVSFLVTVR